MKTKTASRLLLLLTLCTLTAGCATKQPTQTNHDYSPRTDASKFAVNTLLVYLPEFHAAAWGDEVEAQLNQLLKTGDATVRRLPTFFLDVGKTQEINGMGVYTFPSHFNRDGTPAKTTSLNIGALYRVTLLSATNRLAELDLHYERATIIDWKSFGSEEIAPFRTYPVCSKEKLTSRITLEPKIWRVVGSCNTQEINRHVLMLICLQPPSGSALK